MTDRENLCIADSAAGRTPAKRAHAGVDTGRWQMERRIMFPAGWWGKCDCELFDAMQIGQAERYTYPPDPVVQICRFYLQKVNWRVHKCAAGAGERSYCKPARAPFLFATPRYIHSHQLCVNFDECSMYSNWFIDGWPACENTRLENIEITI